METEKRTQFWGWLLLCSCCLIYFFVNLHKVLVPGATFDELQSMFGINAESVTRLGAVFTCVYAVLQVVVGPLADRYSGARVIAVGGSFFCIGAFMSAMDSSLTILYIGRILTGMGAASIYLCCVKEISRIAPKQFPMLLGILLLIGYLGSVVGAAPFIAGVKVYGYVKMMTATAIGVIVSYVIYVLIFSRMFRTLPPVQKEAKLGGKAFIECLKVRYNRLHLMTMCTAFGTFFAIQAMIGKKFLEDYCHVSAITAGDVLTIMMIITAADGFLCAALSRAIGNRRRPFMLFAGFGTLVAVLLLLVPILFNYTHPWPFVTSMLLMSFAGNIGPVSTTLLKENNVALRFGTMVSLSNCVSYLVSAVFGVLFGRLMDIFPPQEIEEAGKIIKVYGRSSYLLAFCVLMIPAILSACASCCIRETYGKNVAEPEDK